LNVQQETVPCKQSAPQRLHAQHNRRPGGMRQQCVNGSRDKPTGKVTPTTTFQRTPGTVVLAEPSSASCAIGSSPNAPLATLTKSPTSHTSRRPTIPEYLNRPISDANILRAMRPQHWVRRHAFGLWWQENRYSSGHDMSPMLRHALNGGWTEEQFKHTAWWVYWQRRSDRDVHGRVRWLEARNLDQISSFSQSIADSRLVIPQSSERQGSHLSMSLDPVLSISRHPIWEECESQEGLLVLPGWEYSLEHRWQALGRLEHRKLTLRFIEQRDALASQSSPS
jgi:hypothetical protein